MFVATKSHRSDISSIEAITAERSFENFGKSDENSTTVFFISRIIAVLITPPSSKLIDFSKASATAYFPLR